MTNWTTRSALVSSAVLALGLAASPALAQSWGNQYPAANSAGNNPGPAGTNTAEVFYGNPVDGAPNSGPYYGDSYNGNGYNNPNFFGVPIPFFGWGPAPAQQQYGWGYGAGNNYPAANSAGNNPGPAGTNTAEVFYGNPNNGNINSAPGNYYPGHAYMGSSHQRYAHRYTNGNALNQYPAANSSSNNPGPSGTRTAELGYGVNGGLNDYPMPNAVPSSTAVSMAPANAAPNSGPGVAGPSGWNTAN